MSDIAIETPRWQLADKARAHYLEVSNAAMYSMSLIPEAITAWEKLPELIEAGRQRADAAYAAGLAAGIERAALCCENLALNCRDLYHQAKGDEIRQRFIGGMEVGADDCAAAIRALLPPARPTTERT